MTAAPPSVPPIVPPMFPSFVVSGVGTESYPLNICTLSRAHDISLIRHSSLTCSSAFLRVISLSAPSARRIEKSARSAAHWAYRGEKDKIQTKKIPCSTIQGMETNSMQYNSRDNSRPIHSCVHHYLQLKDSLPLLQGPILFTEVRNQPRSLIQVLRGGQKHENVD